MTTAVKAANHFCTAYVAAAAEACSRLVGVSRDHIQRLHVNEACPGVSNEVWLHRFASPPFGSLFILSPFTHICFLPFFHVILSSCLAISSFLSFARTWVPAGSFVCTHMCPGLSVYVHNLLQPRLQVAKVFIMRRVFIGCPCALGSLSSQPHTPSPRLARPFHVFILLSLLRPHFHNRPSLNSFCLPSGGRAHLHFVPTSALLASPQGGVCVTFGVTRFLLDCFLFQQGACGHHANARQRSYA